MSQRLFPPSPSRTAQTGASTKANELGMRVDAGARLCAARRAVSADQVAAGLGQVAGADVHRARQAAQPGAQAGDHRRAGALDRRQLRRRAADASTASGPTGRSSRSGTSATRPGSTTAVAKSKVKAVGEFLASDDKVLVCTHATFRFAVDELGVEASTTG